MIPEPLNSLLSGKCGTILGLPVRMLDDPPTGEFRIECLHKWLRLDKMDIVRDPERVNRDLITFVYQTQRENRNGLSGQATSPPPSHSPFAQPGASGILTASHAIAFRQQWEQQLQQQLQQQQHNQQFVVPRGFADPPKPPEPLAFAGFKLGEISGVRGWTIDSHGFLHSMTANVIWAPGEPMDGKTKAGGDHGVHAYKKARDFLKNHGDLHIYGRVALWGDVIEHELGYRAEFAKIVSLDGVLGQQRDDRDLARARERYGLAA